MLLIWPWIAQTANSAFWPWIAADAILTYAWIWRNAKMDKATDRQILENDDRDRKLESKHRRLWPWRKRNSDYIYEIRDTRPKHNRY